MKSLQYSVFIILIFLSLSGCPEPTQIADCTTVVTFPDANLEAAIREEIDKPEGEICLCDVEPITSLWGYGENISDLTGIENLTSLQYLNLSDNSISDISPLYPIKE